MARPRRTRSKKSSPRETALGCGLLIVILVVLSAIGRACSGGDAEVPATQLAPLTTLAPRPTTPRWVPPTTTRPAPTTTTTTARPAPAPDPDPDADRDRRAPAPAPAREEVNDNDDSGSVYYPNCAAVRAAGAAPIRRGEPGYRRGLDSDGDGEGCAGD